MTLVNAISKNTEVVKLSAVQRYWLDKDHKGEGETLVLAFAGGLVVAYLKPQMETVHWHETAGI